MTVLNQPIVGYFLDRLAAVPNASAHRSAIDDVRAGRMAEASRALDSANDTELATAFLKGLVLLSKAELNPAANKFRDALRIDSEFYPAAFYLGACYAAGGRDKEAVGAWQMSLVGEGDAPFVYTLLAETLVRLKDASQAVDVMNEAHSRWPDDDSVTATWATTLVSASKNAEAIGVLDSYLARHPDDQERLFLALRLLYDAHTAKRPLISAAEDRARFLRYADAYITAHGAQEWTVAGWRQQIEK